MSDKYDIWRNFNPIPVGDDFVQHWLNRVRLYLTHRGLNLFSGQDASQFHRWIYERKNPTSRRLGSGSVSLALASIIVCVISYDCDEQMRNSQEWR